jgi:flavin reductase (DIM6/NTAB) family NADH-FMN oxidoreductase RutF
MSKLDLRQLRSTLGRFVTGVTVVTCRSETGERWGFTANSFTSVSLDPPLVMVCLAKTAVCHDAFMKANNFAINILSDGQRAISGTFASRKEDKFEGVELKSINTVNPVVEGVTAWLDCEAYQKLELGDHTVLVGRVLDFGSEDITPLGYFAGSYVSFDDERYASNLGSAKIAKVGAILRHENSILLLKHLDKLFLPTAPSLGEKTNAPGSLFHKLREANLDPRLDFIYSISHDPDSGDVHLYYRGGLAHPENMDHDRAVLVPLDNIPWDRIPSSKYRMMLKRYVQEAEDTRYGIYFGSTDGGAIKQLSEPAAVP